MEDLRDELKSLIEERLKILRVMNEVTRKVDLKEFTETVDLTLDKTIEYLQELVKMDFVRKVDGRYSITAEGKIALKSLESVLEGLEFHFYAGIGQSIGFSAKSLKDFCTILREVEVEALEFHVSRGDFENWITTSFQDRELANDFLIIRQSKLKGENLRNEMLRVTEARYHRFKELLSPIEKFLQNQDSS